MNPTNSVKSVVLQPGASYEDWRNAPRESRQFYVLNACQQCEKRGLGKVNSSVVTALMHQVYSEPKCQTLQVSEVFGMAFAKCAKQ